MLNTICRFFALLAVGYGCFWVAMFLAGIITLALRSSMVLIAIVAFIFLTTMMLKALGMTIERD